MMSKLLDPKTYRKWAVIPASNSTISISCIKQHHIFFYQSSLQFADDHRLDGARGAFTSEPRCASHVRSGLPLLLVCSEKYYLGICSWILSSEGSRNWNLAVLGRIAAFPLRLSACTSLSLDTGHMGHSNYSYLSRLTFSQQQIEKMTHMTH